MLRRGQKGICASAAVAEQHGFVPPERPKPPLPIDDLRRPLPGFGNPSGHALLCALANRRELHLTPYLASLGHTDQLSPHRDTADELGTSPGAACWATPDRSGDFHVSHAARYFNQSVARRSARQEA